MTNDFDNNSSLQNESSQLLCFEFLNKFVEHFDKETETEN